MAKKSYAAPKQSTPKSTGQDADSETITDADIIHAARLLVETYGDFAAAGARIKADQMVALGNKLGEAVWLRVAGVVEDLLADSKPVEAPLH